MSSTATTTMPPARDTNSPVNDTTLCSRGRRRGGEMVPVLMLRIARIFIILGCRPAPSMEGTVTVNALTNPSTPDTVPAIVTREGVWFMCG